MGVPETGNGYDSVAVDVDPAESNRFTGPNPAVEAGAGRVAKFHTGPSWIGHEMRTAELPSARRGHHFKKKKKRRRKKKNKWNEINHSNQPRNVSERILNHFNRASLQLLTGFSY